MNEHVAGAPQKKASGIIGFFKGLGIFVLACVFIAALVLLGIKFILFPGEFKPVKLSDKEEVVLEQKLDTLETANPSISFRGGNSLNAPLEPRAYSEDGAVRAVSFTERELNALIAKNSDLATKLAIDLDDGLASARLRLPLDPDLPVVGGKVLNASAGVELGYENGKPIVVLKGVMIWGVPIPNAWLGNLKNIDLVKEFDGDEGFWKSFSNGIANINLERDKITVRFKE